MGALRWSIRASASLSVSGQTYRSRQVVAPPRVRSSDSAAVAIPLPHVRTVQRSAAMAAPAKVMAWSSACQRVRHCARLACLPTATMPQMPQEKERR